MEVYIQKANFEDAFSMDGVDAEDVKKLFLNFDWDKELELEKELEDAKKDSCPVTLTINADNDYIFQVCIYKGRSTMYEKYEYDAEFMYKKHWKLFGLIPFVSNKSEQLSVNSQSKVLTMIEKFCSKNYDYFLNIIEDEKMNNRYR